MVHVVTACIRAGDESGWTDLVPVLLSEYVIPHANAQTRDAVQFDSIRNSQ